MRRFPCLDGFDARLAAGFVVCLMTWMGASCASQPPAETVGRGIPPDVQSQLARSRTDLVRAVTAFGLDYDRQICQTRKRRAQSKNVRMAISEAYLELTDGIERARREVERRAASAPSPNDSSPREDGIVWMRTRSPSEGSESRPSGTSIGWSCLEITRHKSCAQAAAVDVVESFYRAHVPDRRVRPSVLADLLSVLAEDFEWGLETINARPSLRKARQTIREQCRSGESPLAVFLHRQRSSSSSKSKTTSIDTFEARLVHDDREICETLPIMYNNLVDLLRKRLEQRLIEGDCTLDDWQLVATPIP